MYVQHPYKFNDKYFAKVDGNYYEISKQIAKVMLSDYKKQLYRTQRYKEGKELEVLECVTRDGDEGLSVDDFADEQQKSAEEMFFVSEERRVLYQQIERLSIRDQFIIKAVYIDGLKQAEVAQILGISPGWLSTKIKGILIKLREMYISEGR